MAAKKNYEYAPDFAVPPGETLREAMKALHMSQRELSLRAGLTVQSLDRIFKGEQPITYETANKLELVTGVPARVWNNLEAQYREQTAKQKQNELLQRDLAWLKQIPTADLIARGAIQPQRDKIALLRETLRFYGVSSVAAWREIWEDPKVAARRSRCFESQPGPASAWIRLGEVQAIGIECQPYDRNMFEAAVGRIRALTVLEPKEFVPEMRRLCAEAGVALALVSEMKKVPWDGATKWLSAAKAMVLLNLRHKAEDQFWFSFFHEAGHVLHDSRNSKKALLINDGSEDDPREKRANGYAAKTLIPLGERWKIPSLRSRKAVVAFAEQIGIAPGIVVGQFEHMTEKWGWFNDLKRKFTWR